MTLDDIVASEICEAITIVQPKKESSRSLIGSIMEFLFVKAEK